MRLRRFKPGEPVWHRTYGRGEVLAEWGPLAVNSAKAAREVTPCWEIYDVVFGTKPYRVLHCCRAEYLRQMP